MEIVQTTLSAATTVAVVVTLFALRKANARIRSFGFAVCTVFAALLCLSLAPTFEWSGRGIARVAFAFLVVGLSAHGLRLSLDEAKRDEAKHRADQQGS